MATLSDIVAKGALAIVPVADWESRLPMHALYWTPDLATWVTTTAELHTSKVGGRTPFEHLQQTVADFRCSKRPPAGDLRRMMPTKHGIWKIHSVGLRIYGWFPALRTFAAVTAALEKDTKRDPRLNDRKLDDVRQFLKKHELEGSVQYGDILAIFPPDNGTPANVPTSDR